MAAAVEPKGRPSSTAASTALKVGSMSLRLLLLLLRSSPPTAAAEGLVVLPRKKLCLACESVENQLGVSC